MVLSIEERCKFALMPLSQLGGRFDMLCYMSRPCTIRSLVIKMKTKTGIALSALIEGLLRLVSEVTDRVLGSGMGATVNIPYV